MPQNSCPRSIEDLIARVRAGENDAINEIDRQLESPDQPPRVRSVLRSLRAFCLMQSGRLTDSAAEAFALLTFAQRHQHHDIVAQCHRILAMQSDVLGDQAERHRSQRLAFDAAERSGDALLSCRVAQEFALSVGETGQYDRAADILQRHSRPFDWDDSNELFCGLGLAANLGWALNMANRSEEALVATKVPPERALVGSFGAAIRVERWRAQSRLGHPLDLDAIEALLAKSLENGWAMVTTSVHLLLSRQHPSDSLAAQTHATLAHNLQGLDLSYWREPILRRAAECAHARGEALEAEELEREAQDIRDAALRVHEAQESYGGRSRGRICVGLAPMSDL
ncbi:MAG: hypothetical protein ACJA1R_000371 [Flavobacteriales bacterium]|jgi:hypothetical protein